MESLLSGPVAPVTPPTLARGDVRTVRWMLGGGEDRHRSPGPARLTWARAPEPAPWIVLSYVLSPVNLDPCPVRSRLRTDRDRSGRRPAWVASTRPCPPPPPVSGPGHRPTPPAPTGDRHPGQRPSPGAPGLPARPHLGHGRRPDAADRVVPRRRVLHRRRGRAGGDHPLRPAHARAPAHHRPGAATLPVPDHLPTVHGAPGHHRRP